MSFISETLRQKVRQRAGNRCEYCLSYQDYIMNHKFLPSLLQLTYTTCL